MAADHEVSSESAHVGSERVESGRLPDLRFVVPAANENRWSDLLASMIATDPVPLAGLLEVEFDEIAREVVVAAGAGRRSDRLDVLLRRGGRDVGVIEAKLLSDLGPDQLVRYQAAFPSASAYRVLHLGRLPVNLRESAPWKSLTWEAVLTAYARSSHHWVSATAHAWITQLDLLVPHVDAATVWNDVPDDPAGFELALRARIAWLSSRLDDWCELEHDMVPSSGGGNWAVRMWDDAPAAGHFVTAELQEGLTAYEWKPNPDHRYRDRLPGPVVLLGLRQEGTTTSADFDWRLLHRMFEAQIVGDDGVPRDGRRWQTTPARPSHPVDSQNWQAILAAGAPKWLGKGWGMKVARSTGSCLFGARYGLPPTSTLGEVETELRELQPLLSVMSGITPKHTLPRS